MKVYYALKKASEIVALLEQNGLDTAWKDYGDGSTILLRLDGPPSHKEQWRKAYQLLTNAGYECERWG